MGNMSPPQRGALRTCGRANTESPWLLKWPWGTCRPLQGGAEDMEANAEACPLGPTGREEHVPPPLRGGPGGRRAHWPEKACGLTRQERRQVGGGARASARPGDSATARRWRSERPDGALPEEAGTAVGPDCGSAEGARPARLRGIEPLNECRPKKVSAEADRAQGTYARQRRLTRQGQGQSGRPLVMPLLGLFGGGAGGVPSRPKLGP